MAGRDEAPHFRLPGGGSLRLLEEADAEELYTLVERNRAYLAEWMPWAAGQTLEGTVEFIRKTRKQVEENDGFQTALMLDGHRRLRRLPRRQLGGAHDEPRLLARRGAPGPRG